MPNAWEALPGSGSHPMEPPRIQSGSMSVMTATPPPVEDRKQAGGRSPAADGTDRGRDFRLGTREQLHRAGASAYRYDLRNKPTPPSRPRAVRTRADTSPTSLERATAETVLAQIMTASHLARGRGIARWTAPPSTSRRALYTFSLSTVLVIFSPSLSRNTISPNSNVPQSALLSVNGSEAKMTPVALSTVHSSKS